MVLQHLLEVSYLNLLLSRLISEVGQAKDRVVVLGLPFFRVTSKQTGRLWFIANSEIIFEVIYFGVLAPESLYLFLFQGLI